MRTKNGVTQISFCKLHKVNPCISETLESIFYHVDGEIDAYDPDVKTDLVEILNLNCPKSPIVSEREAALSMKF